MFMEAAMFGVIWIAIAATVAAFGADKATDELKAPQTVAEAPAPGTQKVPAVPLPACPAPAQNGQQATPACH
jgi:hypothetical protein